MSFSQLKSELKSLRYGKRLPGAIYIVKPRESDLSEFLFSLIRRAETAAKPSKSWNLLKLHSKEYAVTFLTYPNFDHDPHPALKESTKMNLNTGRTVTQDFSARPNPPILHRKELFLPPEDPRVSEFAALTRQEENAGLYREKHKIGHRQYWESLLRKTGHSYAGHRLIPAKVESSPSEFPPTATPIERHRTAIKRYDLSKPIKLLLKHDLLRASTTLFDYGCGHGMDVEGLNSLGYSASGWDPAFKPNEGKKQADIVNLGYVLNVIEDRKERETVLREAFHLAQKVLIVSVLAVGQETEAHVEEYADGYLTKSGTFQKFFEHGELEVLIESLLQSEPITLTPGICLVFQSSKAREAFLEKRTRRFVDWTQIGHQLRFSQPTMRQEQVVSRYELHQEILDAYWKVLLDFGRIPGANELQAEMIDPIRETFRSTARATKIALDYHGPDLLQEARRIREEDVMVYLAMKHFERKFLQKDLSRRLKQDIKAFFGDFQRAMQLARELLFASGDPDEIMLAIETGKYGWFDPSEMHLTFHRSFIDRLPAILRVYVFCGARLYGDLDEVDLIKIHVRSGKLTLLQFDAFEKNPLPELKTRVKIDLRRFYVKIFDHAAGPQHQLLSSRSASGSEWKNLTDGNRLQIPQECPA